ncbi:putative phosphoglycerate mutase [Weissella uvarum]|uniref:histidine phosphatase family protein n=1 Tax=Weissella uvarum TaxID=1479233 RepID=UPI00195F99F0|nr:histidine phosphatase family protein [Weissella uvarum]MBM7616851.1 putative phosphoglycerate mutase [Weissella uvarum]MCM0594697.1 histidine phosphatase family protein [Weissella uvarum]
MAFTLYLVRHGQTYLNKYGRMQGWSDAPLTESGISDAQAAGQRLANVDFQGAYSSDLSRARMTAEFILQQNKQEQHLVKPVELPGFREVFFGSYEGLRGADIAPEIAHAKRMPQADEITGYGELTQHLTMDGTMDAMHELDEFGDAEDAAMFWKRFDAAMDAVRQKHQDGDKVLVVAHGSLIRNVVARYHDEQTTHIAPKNGMISVWQVTDDDMQLQAYNDTTTVW